MTASVMNGPWEEWSSEISLFTIPQKQFCCINHNLCIWAVKLEWSKNGRHHIRWLHHAKRLGLLHMLTAHLDYLVLYSIHKIIIIFFHPTTIQVWPCLLKQLNHKCQNIWPKIQTQLTWHLQYTEIFKLAVVEFMKPSFQKQDKPTDKKTNTVK